MNGHWIIKTLDELGEIYAELLKNPEKKTLGEEKEVRFKELVYEIMDFMIEYPGTLIYVKDEAKRSFYKTVIKLAWEGIETDQIIDRLFSLENEKLNFIIGDISERAKKLKPTFISVNPADKEFSVFFEEAINSWLYGNNRAAIILCFSVLEDLLKEKLLDIDDQLVYTLSDRDKPEKVRVHPSFILIKNAYKKSLITKTQKDRLFNIKKKRNDIVHNLHSVKSDETYQMIIQTKEIVEQLLGGK